MAQNCWNISVYVRDARTQALPLVGGGEHDWAYLLGRLGWLPYAEALALDIWIVGVAIYGYALVLGIRAATCGLKQEHAAGSTLSVEAGRPTSEL